MPALYSGMRGTVGKTGVEFSFRLGEFRRLEDGGEFVRSLILDRLEYDDGRLASSRSWSLAADGSWAEHPENGIIKNFLAPDVRVSL